MHPDERRRSMNFQKFKSMVKDLDFSKVPKYLRNERRFYFKIPEYTKKLMSGVGRIAKIIKNNLEGRSQKRSLNRVKDSSPLHTTKKFFQRNRMKIIAVNSVAIILALTVSVTIIYNRNNKAEPVIEKITNTIAEEFFYEGNYSRAIEEYLLLHEKDLDSPLWLLKISEIYSVTGDVENSKKYIDLAKELRNRNFELNKDKWDKKFEDNDIEVMNYIVFTQLMNKDYLNAKIDGEEALKIYGDSKKFIKTMITVYMVNNEFEKARSLVDTYPVDWESAYDIAEHARIMMLFDDWDNGLFQLKNSWYRDKDEYKIFDVIAQISAYNKDLLLEKISELSEMMPWEPAYKMWLAKIYSMREETADQSQEILNSLRGEDVGSIEKVLIQSAIHHHLGNDAIADGLIEKLISEKDDDYRILHTAGWYYLQKKDNYRALQYCKESIIKNSDYTDNYGFLMPEILKAMGKTNEGEPYFRTALYMEPYNYNIMLTLANYYWYTTQNSEMALEYYKFAENIRPSDAEIKYNIALIHITNDRIDDAVTVLKKAIEVNDAVPKYHRTLGTIYLIQGKMEQGIVEIRNAYEADKGDILTLNNAGCYYITSATDLERGVYNLLKAYEGINATTDEFTKKTITENYEKARKLLEEYNRGTGNEVLKIPEFILFY
jgi:Tfp pilus assembly protein PilF